MWHSGVSKRSRRGRYYLLYHGFLKQIGRPKSALAQYYRSKGTASRLILVCCPPSVSCAYQIPELLGFIEFSKALSDQSDIKELVSSRSNRSKLLIGVSAFLPTSHFVSVHP